ncbi:hypothetical protein [Aquimarina sp. 2201CG14-23]|uniref:hypothetical protein n=1 Tax=Aquimarina mycalae TaxID=3040073 RepID=UPI002477CE00|nr:hypothetical protein [Aquimarina sp. 2201CG14-23]MDH7448028.1 hypothetical protein [Aquimarina sp. 2201CG14-23]
MAGNYQQEDIIQKIFSFLELLPIPTQFSKINTETFLPGIKIDKGVLLVDPDKLVHPGDILHEAGHIAVSRPEERMHLQNNVIENNESKSGEELVAMLWSYAAIMDMGLSPEIVFHKEGYKGESEWILDQYRSQNFIGLPLLQWMGLTYTDTETLQFPKMKKWLRT